MVILADKLHYLVGGKCCLTFVIINSKKQFLRRKILYIYRGIKNIFMVNIAKIANKTSEIAAWLKASNKTSILQTKPQNAVFQKHYYY